MSPHIFAVKRSEIDESAYALLRNRDAYVAMSAATVGRLPMTPPVPREKSLVPIQSPGGESFLPDFGYDEELAAGYELKYGRA